MDNNWSEEGWVVLRGTNHTRLKEKIFVNVRECLSMNNSISNIDTSITTNKAGIVKNIVFLSNTGFRCLASNLNYKYEFLKDLCLKYTEEREYVLVLNIYSGDSLFLLPDSEGKILKIGF